MGSVTLVIAPTPANERESNSKTEATTCRADSVVTNVFDDDQALLNDPIGTQTDRARRDGYENENGKVRTTIIKCRPECSKGSLNRNNRAVCLAFTRNTEGSGNRKYLNGDEPLHLANA